ncbi:MULTISPECIES: (d)CMP kinase [unclassified Polynucleobacter]|uniref:(d)CMP kinase n=1 Tax=unclassified Polynucleobacter TaxID=2640945 RepID=UPI0025732A19|nr:MULTISPECIES: (d)CMP kinase [unclassified Polynucleobacter]BEI42277.1 cytidylate kinase CmK [Polynucleobacter sp. HIN10]BEI44030.1 cytidylate kinase CmK [Polynucleobacter sp. HIN11]
MSLPPVIAIDGPTASGKGTVAMQVANRLGFHYLDSGALYRLVALASQQKGVPPSDCRALGELALAIQIEFKNGLIFLGGEDVTEAIRDESIGVLASQIAVYPEVRDALLARQRGFRRTPGLVADGRDMASRIFTDAVLKVFLTASVEARAERRYKQLIAKGISARMDVLLQDLQERDARDIQRATAPLKQVEGAHLLDTSNLSIDQAVEQVLSWYQDVNGR